ncbi:MAG TPA: hypothetical protein VJL59_10270 [Anaerolineales bacterium]|nr:hypothetical protein [Anaerolineales bacterium]
MLVVKGVYERGQIRLIEPVPSQIEGPREVTVTFAETRATSKARGSALALIGLLNTLTAEQMVAFDKALQRTPFLGAREIVW